MIVYEIEVEDSVFDRVGPGRYVFTDIWVFIARVTGSHVSPQFCQMVVRALGADTITTEPLLHRRAYRYTFTRSRP